MKFFSTLLLGLMLTSSGSFAQKELKSHQSQHNFEETLEIIKSTLAEKDIKVMQVIDHDDNAESAGLELEKTKVLVFGNPAVGTKLMQSNADIALELPLRILVMERGGHVTIKYTDPTHWEEKYNLQDQREILANMAQLLNKVGRNVETGEKR